MCLPTWLRHYQSTWWVGDLSAGVVVALLLVPQGLAYAMLAGLPPATGLYASVIPLVAYALLGSSRQQSVGPMAVTALMTGAAIAPFAHAGSVQAVHYALALALLSGLFLLGFAVLKMGWLAHYLSQPVITGFTAGSVVLIILSQLPPLFGVDSGGRSFLVQVPHLIHALPHTHGPTLWLSLASLLFLWWSRGFLSASLQRLGIAAFWANLATRLAPAVWVVLVLAATAYWRLDWRWGWHTIGVVPSGLPTWSWPDLTWREWQTMFVPALLLGLMNFVQSISVAQSLALRRGERIEANCELAGLGLANVAAGLSSGMPVTGGLSRSAVNAAAGANTQMSSVITALLLLPVLLFASDVLQFLPQAVLAATIVIAVSSMFGWSEMRQIWRYDRADGLAMLFTFFTVVLAGVAEGIMVGMACSLAFLVWRSSHPHIAELGRLPNTQHYRNVLRYPEVERLPGVMLLRVDESFYFANVQFIEDNINRRIQQQPEVKHLVLVLSAVNSIDASAFACLLQWQQQLQTQGITLHLAEVKGPVYDRLQQNDFLTRFQGQIFLSTHQVSEFFRMG